MKQLKLGEILDFVKALKEEGMTDKEIKSLPVYIGDDDELNGIHCAWYTNLVDADDTEDEENVYIVELMDLEKGKAILISYT